MYETSKTAIRTLQRRHKKKARSYDFNCFIAISETVDLWFLQHFFKGEHKYADCLLLPATIPKPFFAYNFYWPKFSRIKRLNAKRKSKFSKA